MFPTRKITTSGGDVFRDEFSLAFDGTNDYIDLSGTFNYNVHSISIWLKETATSGQSTIFDHRDGNNDGINFYLASGQPLYAVNNVDAHYTTSLDLNQWSHIVLTNDGSTSTIYVNGVSVKTADTSGETINISSSANARFARDNTGNYFTGNLSEAAIYDKALSASEVKTLYNSREPYNHKEGVCSSNLKAWWRMGDGVLDSKQNNHSHTGIVSDETNPTLNSDLLAGKGDFSDASYWSTVSGQSIVEDNVGKFLGNGSYNAITKSGILTVGKIYRCQLDCTANSGTAININQTSFFPQVVPLGQTGTHFCFFKPTGTTFTLYAPENTYGETATIDNVIVQEVNGNAGALINFITTSCFEGDTP